MRKINFYSKSCIIYRNNSVRDIDKYADEALAINRMVEHNFSNNSIPGCLSKSSSFNLDQDSMNQSVQQSIIFKLDQESQDDDEDRDDENDYDDYNDHLCKELSIDEEFTYSLDRFDSFSSISKLIHSSDNNNNNTTTTKLHNTAVGPPTTAPITMKKMQPPQSETELDDQASTLKESGNIIISSSSSDNASRSLIKSDKPKAKKNSFKHRQRKDKPHMLLRCGCCGQLWDESHFECSICSKIAHTNCVSKRGLSEFEIQKLKQDWTCSDCVKNYLLKMLLNFTNH